MASVQSQIVELHCEDRDGRVRVVFPDKHIMVLPTEAAVRACGAFKDQITFQDQFYHLHQRIAEWLKDHKDLVERAYLTVRDNGLLFLVVQNETRYNDVVEEALSDLDLLIANDDDFRLIRFDVQSLPLTSEESTTSFLARGNTFRYRIDNGE